MDILQATATIGVCLILTGGITKVDTIMKINQVSGEMISYTN
ncbi:hypothetical protein [Clostridium kluyveri]|nr:hypothetical protein [Clostridium kluyveri]UZQ49996.1 hypothetical protein OP486_18920 [Clostridium kluyveri]